MSVFTESLPYRIVTGDAAQGTLSHAYLLICPDERNLRAFLKELAKVILGADARAATRSRTPIAAYCLPKEQRRASRMCAICSTTVISSRRRGIASCL